MSEHSLSRRAFLGAGGYTLASLGLSLASGPARAFADSEASVNAAEAGETIAIVHTNDIHCVVRSEDEGLNYAAVVDYVENLGRSHAVGNVMLVDSGDILQGSLLGGYTTGKAPAQLFRACGYNIAAVGNHEVDYGLERLLQLARIYNIPFVCCNLLDLSGKQLFDPYVVKEYQVSGQTVRIAYVGVLTPETVTKGGSTGVRDSDGNLVCSCCEDETGAALYDAVQTAVDDARTTGNADYVVLLAHLGQGGITTRWRSDTVIANTHGIDLALDGHSHESYIKTAQNDEGQDVLIMQNGMKLASFGHVEINPASGDAMASLDVSAEHIKSWYGWDAQIMNLLSDLRHGVEPEPLEIVGFAASTLYATPEDDFTGSIHHQETNLGDLVADAFYAEYQSERGKTCDLAVAFGWGLQNIRAGWIEYEEIANCFAFCNMLAAIEVTGQFILDMLEVGAASVPQNSVWFLQVSSGFSYTVRQDIPTPVVLNENNTSLVKIEGERRVRDAMLNGQALDPSKTYVIVGADYLLLGENRMPSVPNPQDADCFAFDAGAVLHYIENSLDGAVGSDYKNPDGAGRIKIVDHDESGSDDDSKTDPQPQPQPQPTPESDPEDTTPKDTSNTDTGKTTDGPLPATGDSASAATVAAVALGTGALAAAVAVRS